MNSKYFSISYPLDIIYKFKSTQNQPLINTQSFILKLTQLDLNLYSIFCY